MSAQPDESCFSLEPMSGKDSDDGVSSLVPPGSLTRPFASTSSLPEGVRLGVPLGNGHGEGEPRFPLHLQ